MRVWMGRRELKELSLTSSSRLRRAASCCWRRIARFGQLPEPGAGRRAPIHTCSMWWYASGYLTMSSISCSSSSAATRARGQAPSRIHTPRLPCLMASNASSYRWTYLLITPFLRHSATFYTRSQSPATNFWPSVPSSPPETTTQLSQGLP